MKQNCARWALAALPIAIASCLAVSGCGGVCGLSTAEGEPQSEPGHEEPSASEPLYEDHADPCVDVTDRDGNGIDKHPDACQCSNCTSNPD
jgi:hypothetical protein